jgi:polysaccharide biosynthesis/export protein
MHRMAQDQVTGRHARTRARSVQSLFLVGVLAGCAVVPGIRVDTRPDAGVWTPEGQEAGDFAPEVRRIDADLLLEQRRARRDSVNPQSRRELVADYQYRIGSADVINVVVWGHPELSNPMGQFQNIEQQARLVREDGTMFFPYVGVIEVAGKTIEEIRELLTERLEPFVTDPQVDVRVISFRSKKVYVTGAVRQPGTIPLTDDPLTALDAINKAGGFGELADRRRAVITRDGEQKTIDILELYASGRGDLLLEDRDVLYVPDNQFNRVFVMGEIQRQTAVPLHEGRLTLAEAITGADGLNLGTADTRNIFVLRGRPMYDGDGVLQGIRPEIYHLDARDGVALVLAEGFELEPRDIIYAASTGMVRFNRVIQQILPTVQTLWQTDRILRD